MAPATAARVAADVRAERERLVHDADHSGDPADWYARLASTTAATRTALCAFACGDPSALRRQAVRIAALAELLAELSTPAATPQGAAA